MKDFLMLIGVVVLVLIIGFFTRSLLIMRIRKNMPGRWRKKRIFKQINGWKDLGYNYNKRLRLLIDQGYDKSVANVLLGEVEYLFNPHRDRDSDDPSKEMI